ncbi:ABC transporter ATP-binding protein/permease [Opitutales bacterium]|nr:ABC transporter ATP-binding protein/permease [Opitutales bacterium]
MIRDLYSLFNTREKFSIVLLLISILISAIFDLLVVYTFPKFFTFFDKENVSEFYFLNSIIKISEFVNISVPILFTLIFILMFLLNTFFKLLTLYLQTNFSFNFGTRISNEYFRSILNQPFNFFIETDSSEHISILSNKINVVVGNIIIPILIILTNIVSVLFIITYLFITEFLFTLFIFLSITSAYLLISFVNRRTINKHSSVLNKNSDKNIKLVKEAIHSFKSFNIFEIKNLFNISFAESNTNLRRSQKSIHYISNIPKYILELFVLCILIISILFFAFTDGLLHNLSLFTLFGIAVFKLLPALQVIYGSYTRIRSVNEILFQVCNNFKKLNKFIISYNNEKFHFNNFIKIYNLFHIYPVNSKFNLNIESLEIHKGSFVGIVGKTGSGKSTLLNNILGNYMSFSDYYLDSKKLNNFQLNALKYSFTYVPQDVYLFNDSIEYNIKLDVEVHSKSGFDYDTCLEIVSLKHSDFTHKLGEGSTQISGGQKQRIGLARSLYHLRENIILDESTSSLDSITENSILDFFSKLPRHYTIFMVTHNKNNLKFCTHLIDLDKSLITVDKLK